MKKRESLLSKAHLDDITNKAIEDYLERKRAAANISLRCEVPEDAIEMLAKLPYQFMDGHLPKPSKPKDIKEAISQYLSSVAKGVYSTKSADRNLEIITILLPGSADKELTGAIKHRMNAYGYFSPCNIKYNQDHQIAIMVFEPKENPTEKPLFYRKDDSIINHWKDF